MFIATVTVHSTFTVHWNFYCSFNFYCSLFIVGYKLYCSLQILLFVPCFTDDRKFTKDEELNEKKRNGLIP